jgi:hypothetical protein
MSMNGKSVAPPLFQIDVLNEINFVSLAAHEQ